MRYQRLIGKDKAPITRVYGGGKNGEVVPVNETPAVVEVPEKKSPKASVKK